MSLVRLAQWELPGAMWDGATGDDESDELHFAEEKLEDDEELKIFSISNHDTFKKILGFTKCI